MDVVSLLNSSNAAVDQQQNAAASPCLPIRNRTPWDAGGYSMPINPQSKTSISPIRQNSYDGGHSENPDSTAHRASDSRSSLSSFSSYQSTTHSRFSSMSTVNSWNPLEGSDCLSPELRTVREALELASLSMKMEPNDKPHVAPRRRPSLSPASSLGTLAAAPEHQLFNLHSQSRSQSAGSPRSLDDSSISPPCVTVSPVRPSSPSDAILIKRTNMPSLRVDTGDFQLSRELPEINQSYLNSQHSNHLQISSHPKRHKRAVSAPDFNFTMTQHQSHGPQAEPTPPSSLHPDRSSPESPPAYSSPDTPPATSGEAEATSVVCMYIPSCDTGSQLRKAISHIFGRNKMCTRLIPQDVWVHYCRKHYQRSRYRNPKEYAKLQCDLVQQQIRRVHEWSQTNLKNGQPGTVQDWGLSVRKREQKRLDDLGGASRKRRANTFERESDEEDNAEEPDSAKVPPTAVPAWLLSHCGQGYSTHAILDIFNRLHTEILSDRMACFPDIEILPNIVVDREADKSPKNYAKRPGGGSGHKRSQSLGVGMKSDYFSHDRRLSQVSLSTAAEDSAYDSPVQKKRRPNRLDDSLEGFQFERPRERSIESARRVPHLAHRPVFADIDEHQVMEDGYAQQDTQMRDSFYSRSPAYGQAPLAAPVPQRLSSTPMATQLEFANAQEPAHRRLSHHRSMSDLGAINRGRPYAATQRYAPQHESPHVDGYSRSAVYEPQHYREHHTYQHRRAGGHARNQSTPMITPFYNESSSQGSEQSGFNPDFPSHSQTGMRPSHRIAETNETRNLYAERR